MIEIKNLNINYDDIKVVTDLNLEIKPGEMVCVIGPNGSGKTTLLKAIAQIKNYNGLINYKENNMTELSRKEMGKVMALLSQNSNNYFAFKVYDVVMNGRYPYIDGLFSGPTKSDHKIVKEALERVGMFEHKDCKIDALSGGQLQRVYLAKLLSQQPDIILLDEPTNHLDLKYQIETLEFIKEITVNDNKISIVVLHDLNLVQRYADKVIMLASDSDYIVGEPSEILKSDNLIDYYHIDINNWMQETLSLWRK